MTGSHFNYDQFSALPVAAAHQPSNVRTEGNPLNNGQFSQAGNFRQDDYNFASPSNPSQRIQANLEQQQQLLQSRLFQLRQLEQLHSEYSDHGGSTDNPAVARGNPQDLYEPRHHGQFPVQSSRQPCRHPCGNLPVSDARHNHQAPAPNHRFPQQVGSAPVKSDGFAQALMPHDLHSQPQLHPQQVGSAPVKSDGFAQAQMPHDLHSQPQLQQGRCLHQQRQMQPPSFGQTAVGASTRMQTNSYSHRLTHVQTSAMQSQHCGPKESYSQQWSLGRNGGAAHSPIYDDKPDMRYRDRGGACNGNFFHKEQAAVRDDFPENKMRYLTGYADISQDSNDACCKRTVEEKMVQVLDQRGKPIDEVVRCATFDEVPFVPAVMASLRRSGFPAPSEIQQYTWPLALMGRDTIGVAATGSGKTLAFLLPAFSFILEHNIQAGDPTLLVMAPTRELAVQIQVEASKFGQSSGINTTCIYGGAPKRQQSQDIRYGVHGVIGTPGRINDFLAGCQLRLNKVSKLVLDEADRMLDMGFEPQIRTILEQIPVERHTMFFTATWPKSIRQLAAEFLQDPLRVQIGGRDELKGNQDIVQIVRVCHTPIDKQRALMDTLSEVGVVDRSNASAKAIVFCSTKVMCEQLAQELRRNSVPCASIHGDKEQRERERALGNLRAGRIQLLVATDVAARGLDIKGITLVINFDAPNNTEDYVHRIGRTGRAGQKGWAVSLVSSRDCTVVRGIIDVMRRTNQEVSAEVEQLCFRRGGNNRNRGSGGFRNSGFNGNRGGGFSMQHSGGFANQRHPMAKPPAPSGYCTIPI